MHKKRFLSAAAAAIMLLSACQFTVSAEDSMRDMTTMELVRDMGIGINLGNTFEACPDWYGEDWIAKWSEGKPNNYETAWGSPVITKEIIEGMAKEGFGVLRIPVAWSNMMAHDGTYTINSEWDARIHEVVNMTLESGMYAIINIHWDGGWMNKMPEDKDETMKRFKHMWEQIADSFKNYGDRLMFESQNEELGWESIWNPWGGTNGKAESYALCNQVNQAFVDVIRASGGNNPKRHLLISGYNTGFDRTCDDLFKMPNDPANRMAVSVHYYSPAGFAILEEDADWGKAVSTWGTDSDYASLRSEMNMMKTHFTDKGIPVIVGEYGCPTKNKEPESVRRFLSSVCEEAYKCGHCPVLWSTPDSKQDDGTVLKGHYDRTTCKMNDQELQKKLYAIGGKPFSPLTVTTEETTTTTTTTTTTETTTTTSSTAATTTPAPETTTAASPSATVWGDADCSGSFELNDCVLLAKATVGIDGSELSASGKANCDLLADGSVNSGDVGVALKLMAGIYRNADMPVQP